MDTAQKRALIPASVSLLFLGICGGVAIVLALTNGAVPLIVVFCVLTIAAGVSTGYFFGLFAAASRAVRPPADSTLDNETP